MRKLALGPPGILPEPNFDRFFSAGDLCGNQSRQLKQRAGNLALRRGEQRKPDGMPGPLASTTRLPCTAADAEGKVSVWVKTGERIAPALCAR